MPQDKERKFIFAFSLTDVKQKTLWILPCMYVNRKCGQHLALNTSHIATALEYILLALTVAFSRVTYDLQCGVVGLL